MEERLLWLMVPESFSPPRQRRHGGTALFVAKAVINQ